jgi:diguanylate cyclase (GGDEF)-like protein
LVRARVATQLRLKRLTDQLRVAARTDALTGIANRRAFDDTLEHEWQRGRRGDDPISLLLIDVDHFKQFNDRYGHPKGDDALQMVAKTLTAAARRTGDFVARCGGEEFALLLPETPRLGAELVARRVLDSIAALNIVHSEALTVRHLTVSVGIGCYDQESVSWIKTMEGQRVAGADWDLPCAATDLVVSADKALYAAKRAGRAQFRLQDVSYGLPSLAGETDASLRVQRAV